MPLLLKPALRRLWRADGSLQLGVDPATAIVIDGVTSQDDELLSLLDGTRDPTQAAHAAGVPGRRAQALVDLLCDAGALEVPVAAPSAGLEPDALALSVLHGEPGGEVLRRRGERRVDVRGAGRCGSALALLLGAAGVGDVRSLDPGPLRAADLSPAGVRSLRDSGAAGSRGAVTQRLVRGLAPVAPPEAEAGPAGATGLPDLVILAATGSTTPPELRAAVRHVPHLEVAIRETAGVIGPLVLPGVTPCLRCAELARTDRDPHWPWLSAQLVGSRRHVGPCDVTLATATAALAAMHALRFLDRAGTAGAGADDAALAHPAVGGVVELSLRDLRMRRRTITAHPRCGCGAAM